MHMKSTRMQDMLLFWWHQKLFVDLIGTTRDWSVIFSIKLHYYQTSIRTPNFDVILECCPQYHGPATLNWLAMLLSIRLSFFWIFCETYICLNSLFFLHLLLLNELAPVAIDSCLLAALAICRLLQCLITIVSFQICLEYCLQHA